MSAVLKRTSVYEIIKKNAEKCPDREAVVSASGKKTYAQLDCVTENLAKRLLKAGIRNGTCVSLIADTEADSVCVLYALLKLSAKVAVISPALTAESLHYELSLTGTEFVILYREPAERCSFDGFTVITKIPEEEATEEEYRPVCEKCDIDTSGVILFTSGTTSFPKAVLLSQYRLLNNALNHKRFLGITGRDRFVASLPVNHILCIVITLLVPLVSRATVCITADRHTESILRTISEERCTVMCGVPSLYHALVSREDLPEFDLSGLRIGFTGGAPCSKALFSKIEQALGITLISTLGQTETTGGFTRWDKSETEEERRTSVGYPSRHMRVKIMDGEICVKGYLLCGGYIGNPEAEKELFDEKGWLHTGDMGEISEKGLIYVTGRKKDIIIRSGENISANQVSEVIETLPGVSECKVIGIPDEHRGEELCACIVRKDPDLSEEDVKTYAGQKTEIYKVPRYVLFYEEFPRTEVGKVKLSELRENAIGKIRKT